MQYKVKEVSACRCVTARGIHQQAGKAIRRLSLWRHAVVRLAVLGMCCAMGFVARAQQASLLEAARHYFRQYRVTGYQPRDPMRLDSLRADDERHELRLYANEPFCAQPFTPQSVSRTYAALQQALPAPYNTYRLMVCSGKGQPIEDLVPNMLREDGQDAARLWGSTRYEGLPWVTYASLPYRVTEGLQNHHLFVWPSHGRYYKNGAWQWQRPYLYATTEDLFTQSFVYPYLFPMLERAGAIVASPRERDSQTAEAVVDNDSPDWQGTYSETEPDDAQWASSASGAGFAVPDGCLTDSTLPFQSGTWRAVPALMRKSRLAAATWTPRLPRAGRYAVYVSYATRPNSVPDAHYTIYHKGGRTQVKVNQQMGGGTWVYVGTYEFDEGEQAGGKVVLTNQSNYRGVVTADGVRFGGGMGQVARATAGTSGLPRFLEAARYYAQWAGVPDSLFNTEAGTNDYYDDLRVRGHMLNYLAGGSVYLPGHEGLRVPFELALAIHSDAGVRSDRGIYGSLSICTTQDAEGNTDYPAGLSRQASSDFSALLLDNLTRDLTRQFGVEWTRREHWDRNYGETRMPQVPSAILEMLSHQNFADMRYGHDPLFKFALARSVYKTILHFVNYEHGCRQYTVQPLPPRRFAALLSADGQQAELSWQATEDTLCDRARATGYVLYTRMDNDAFDNGVYIGSREHYTYQLAPGHTYAFRVTAVNAGGESFPSETLAVRRTEGDSPRLLLVNGFDRLSGPAFADSPDSLGFDLDRDWGVPYISTTAYSGRQQVFSRQAPMVESPGGMAYSGHELQGRELAGNTFDYTFAHGRSIAAAGNYSFCSVSREAFESEELALSPYAAIDYIAGLQADMPHNLRPYKTFTPAVQRQLGRFAKQGGALLVSGSYIGSDNVVSPADRDFVEQVLKCRFDGSARTDTTDYVSGLNLQFLIYRQPGPAHYAAHAPDALQPAVPQAFSAFAYGQGQGAGVAYPGADYRAVVMGFPFECICESWVRDKAMKALLKFLIP